eukprot:405569_1
MGRFRLILSAAFTIFDFFTDVIVSVDLLQDPDEDEVGITLGAILMAVSVIGVCMGLIWIRMNWQDDDMDHHLCNVKIAKILIEDFTSMIIIYMTMSEDCSGGTNWLGMDKFSMLVISATTSSASMIFVFCMHCGVKTIKDDWAETSEKICGCCGALLMLLMIILVWMAMAAQNFGCGDPETDSETNSFNEEYDTDTENSDAACFLTSSKYVGLLMIYCVMCRY